MGNGRIQMGSHAMLMKYTEELLHKGKIPPLANFGRKQPLKAAMLY